jgi:curli production assembly/transport component CsgG
MAKQAGRLAGAALMAMVSTGCGITPSTLIAEEPVLDLRTTMLDVLQKLPPPAQPLVVAVYDFPDQTGQYKPSESVTVYSRAVTQGAVAVLVDTLAEAGNGRWFTVLERQNLDNLLQERQLIRANREQFLGPDGQPLKPLGPLLNAGLVIEGAIVGFDSNVLTGGFGARFLGIGGSTEYRRDMVQVHVRAVSTLTGQVLTTVSSAKTIYSVAVQAGVFRYVASDELLEIEGGVTTNEPTHLAVTQAIQKGVYGLILEGAKQDYWSFADEDVEESLIKLYELEKRGAASQEVS